VITPLPHGRCIYYESATISEGDAGRLILGDTRLDDQSATSDPRLSADPVVTFVVEGSISPKFISPSKHAEVLGHIVGICRDELAVPWMACSHFMTPQALEANHRYTAPVAVDHKYELVETVEVEFVRMSAVTGWRQVHCCSKNRFYSKHIAVVNGDAEHTGGKKTTSKLQKRTLPRSSSSPLIKDHRQMAGADFASSHVDLFSFGTNGDPQSKSRKQKAYFSHILYSKRSGVSKTRARDPKS